MRGTMIDPKQDGEASERVEAIQERVGELTGDITTQLDAMREDREVRVTSATGGSKGTKEAQYALIPTRMLDLLARHYGRGAKKYERVNGLDNWRNGYDWSLSYSALMRHLVAFWQGEEVDEETGSPHLVAVIWHATTLLEFMETQRAYDDRQDVISRRVKDA